MHPSPRQGSPGGLGSGDNPAPEPRDSPSPAAALVVGVAREQTGSIVSLLTGRQFQVTLADTYARARERLAARPPAVLITEIRLAEYNGLQLVLHGKALRPTMAALALSSVDDPVLQAETEAIGATFVVTPVPEVELAAAVFRTIFSHRKSSAPIRPPFERRSAERRAADLAMETDRRRFDRRRKMSEGQGAAGQEETEQ